MKLEFKTYKINEDSFLWKTLCKNTKNPVNSFVVVGEDKKTECYLVHHDDIFTISNMKITETATPVRKTELTLISNEYAEYDIPRKNLTMKIIEEIQRLNADE